MKESFSQSNNFLEKLELAKQKILKPEEYEKSGITFPHLFKFENQNKKIHFLAVDHSPDSQTEQFLKIREAFTNISPNVVFIEGMGQLEDPRHPAKKAIFEKRISQYTENEIIERGGEPMFTYQLALEKDIPVISPEYTDEEEAELFRQSGYSEDDILLFCGTRSAMMYAYQDRKSKLPTYIADSIRNIIQDFKWQNYDSSFEHFKTLAIQEFGDSVDFENGSGFHEKCNPNPPKEDDSRGWFKTNKMNQILSRKRDEKILQKLAEMLEVHDKIFVVYGGSHAIMLKPAIEYIVNNISTLK